MWDRAIADVRAEIAELRRRLAGMVVHGTVAEVDPAAATVRLKVGDTPEGPFLGPPIPYAQVAGALKAHIPPSVGQQMTMFSPGGDWRQGVALPMTWSDETASPSQAGDAHAITFGSVRVDLTAGGLKATVGGAVVDITAAGLKVSVGGTTFNLTSGGFVQTGGEQSHNGKDVGDSHRHTDVMPGGALTGPPS